MTAGAVANRHEAAVLDGAVRDISEIRRDFDFQVFARSAAPGTTLGRAKTIASQIPVEIGGILVHPGDIIVGDFDGVVVIPRDHAEAVLEMAQEIDEREAEQARLIGEEKSLRKGLAKYGRI
jgi:regulator of RNase E activity RraA